jgi:S-adenosylmethionine hydrolase
MALITLTTDWRSTDYYSGMMKGRLSILIPGVEIIDLAHSIEPFHAIQAAFILKQALLEFPAGTIHFILVNKGHQEDIWPAVALHNGQYLVGWDDGMLSLIMESEPDYFLRLNPGILDLMDQKTEPGVRAMTIHPTFPELSVFPRIAKYLASGGRLEGAGQDSKDYLRPNPWLPMVSKGLIDGQVIFIDGYGNAVTNISRQLFEKTSNSNKMEITIKSNRYRINAVSDSYMSADPGELTALFNASDYLEISIIQGNAAELLGLETGSPIKIKFEHDQPGGSAAVFQTTA